MPSKPAPGPKKAVPGPKPTRPAAASTPAAPDGKRAPTLTSLRGEIDRIDKELVDLLNRRAEIAVAIGGIKRGQGLDIWSAAREDEVLTRALAASRGPLPDETLRLIFRELMSGSRAVQSLIRIACLGPRFSDSHLASVAKFGEGVEHVPVGSIAAVFDEVQRRHVQFGIVPLENTTEGRVAETLDQFIRTPNLKIRAEVRLKVRLNLIGKCEQAMVRRVYASGPTLARSRHWLGRNLTHATHVEVVSTAAAAEFAQREPFAAAIGSHPAGEAFGLTVITANIDDQAGPPSRFAVIAERPEQRTGRDKTTLIVRIADAAGNLVKAIAPFEKNGVNLTWIESFSTPDVPAERGPTYLFFVDVDGHMDDENVARSIDQARRRCDRLEILGSYPKGKGLES